MHQLLRTIAEDDDSAFYSGASKAVQHVDNERSDINGEQRAVKHGGEQRRRYERLLDTLLGPIFFEAALGHWFIGGVCGARARFCLLVACAARFAWWKRAASGAETRGNQIRHSKRKDY